MIAITHIGMKENFPYYLGGLFVCMLFSLLIRQIRGKAANKAYAIRWLGVFMVLIASFVVNGLAIGYFKETFAYPRPYVALASEHVVLLENRASGDDFHSFPSGHVGFTSMMVVGLWPVLSGDFCLIGALTILAVAWSRMALGVHFPADTVGGFVIALVGVVLVRKISYWLLRRLFGLHCE